MVSSVAAVHDSLQTVENAMMENLETVSPVELGGEPLLCLLTACDGRGHDALSS
jgi:hypothetical protein